MTHPEYGRDRLVEIFMQGMLGGSVPDVPPVFEDLEAAAKDELDPAVFGFAAGSAGAERTAAANETAFGNWQIVPRMMRDVEERDLTVDLFGRTLPAPILLAPIGIQSIYHEEAELASARAAASMGFPFVQSSVATTPLEEVADETGEAPAWFQLYWSSNRELAASFIDRAEAAGYEALVVTVDSPIVGWRERDVQQGYFPFLDGEGLGNYFTDPVFRDLLTDPPEENEDAAILTFLDVFGDGSLTWADLEWVADRTDLPVIVKGVLHPADAQAAVNHGADGIVVSNHGGRQVDNAIPAIEALPEVIDAVDEPVLFDSGIRRGADIVTAMALGAEAVLVGRPYIYGLAIDGADGVEAVCQNLLADLDLTLGLSGHASVDDLDRKILRRADQ